MTGPATPAYRTDLNLTGALYYAEAWAQDANNAESRAYCHLGQQLLAHLTAQEVAA